MAALTAAILTTGAQLKGQQDIKRAQQSAASQQAEAAAKAAQLLKEQGRMAEADIAEASAESARRVSLGIEEARGEIQPFTEAAAGFDVAKGLIMGGGAAGGPLAESIRQASLGGAASPAFDISGDPIQREIQRQAGLSVSAATPEITGALLAQGQQGIGAIGDVARIGQRGFESLADIATGGAAGRASALIGQAPQLQQLATSQQEARLLSDIAGQQAQTATGETLARLAGRVM